MTQRKTTMYTLIFVAVFALAGLAHYYEYVASKYSSLFMVGLTVVYMALVMVWVWSIRIRLLPTRARAYITAAAGLMVLFLILRTIRYRILTVDDVYAMQWTWYLYYVPYMLVPTLFLMACIYSAEWQGAIRTHIEERWLLLVPAVFLVFVFTNQWHGLVFDPMSSAPLIGLPRTYWYGPIFYVIWTIFISEAVLGVGLLVSVTRRTHNLVRAIFPLLLILGYALLLTYDNYLGLETSRKPYNTPELSVFGALVVFESSIRVRLIPYNEHYEGFFEGMRLPAEITDRELNVQWHSKEPVQAEREQRAAAIVGDLRLDENTRLCAHPLGMAGYVFYTEDETELNDLNRRLGEVNRTIEEENALIERENEVREQRARVASRNEIYRHIREVMRIRQAKISDLVANTAPDAPDLRQRLAEVLVRSAFIKRGSNMLLSVSDGEQVTAADLLLALDEPLRYLKYCRIHAGVTVMAEGAMDAKAAFDLYATFEDVIEALLGKATRIVVAMQEGMLRISANVGKAPKLEATPLPVASRAADGGCYFVIKFGEGVAA